MAEKKGGTVFNNNKGGGKRGGTRGGDGEVRTAKAVKELGSER